MRTLIIKRSRRWVKVIDMSAAKVLSSEQFAKQYAEATLEESREPTSTNELFRSLLK